MQNETLSTEIDTTDWDADYDNVLRVGEYLVHGTGISAENLLHFFSKPWHYADEYRATLAYERAIDAAFEAGLK